MSVEKRDFYGKEVTDAIKKACETLNVPQEMLDIEVVETGSTGIFGLIRKKACIRVSVKVTREKPKPAAAVAEAVPSSPAETVLEVEEAVEEVIEESAEPEPAPEISAQAVVEPQQENRVDEKEGENGTDQAEVEVDASQESLEIVETELTRLLELMGFSSTVQVTADGLSVYCGISGEFEEQLAGPEGKTLDSIQYLVRKMVARKCTERLRITVNAGNFRERRLEELKERAVDLAEKVKETGKTHVLPALNPSERREIHMILQEDKDVRSRSVGDGLFKKILIYKPGKGNRGGRRKSGPRGRRGKNNKNGKTSGEE